MEALIDIIIGFGVLAIIGVIYAESGLLIGFFLPGDSLLFTAGLLAQQGVINWNIHLLVVALFAAAALGDSTGYAFGRRVGRKLFKRPDSMLFKQENVQKAEAFYEKYGAKTIILARFVPIVRTFAPIVAGIGNMKYSTFIAYNLVGGAVWAAGITYIGYYSGAWFEQRGINIDQYLLPIIAGIVLVSLLPAVYHVLKDAETRASLKAQAAKTAAKVKQKIKNN